jgi:hypothetical protein
MSESMFAEPIDELRALLARAVQRRDEAAAAGEQAEAARLAEVACQLDGEIRQTERASREKQRAECDELGRMFAGHPKPYYRGETGWK